MFSRLFSPVALIICCCFVSCVTTDYASSDASDAWLDTAPRVSQQPKRPQSTLADWNTGLPSVAHVKELHEREQQRRWSKSEQMPAAYAPREAENHSVRGGYSYTVHSYWPGSYRAHCRKGHRNSGREPYVRSVEKVGPSIVPRAPVHFSTNRL